MRVGIFLIGAIVLIVFGIIATSITTGADAGQFLGVSAITWFMASFLSYLTDIAIGWGYADGRWGRG
jgi:hypothetical protein